MTRRSGSGTSMRRDQAPTPAAHLKVGHAAEVRGLERGEQGRVILRKSSPRQLHAQEVMLHQEKVKLWDLYE
jgi:hypothetical protein